jgi:hypothetical protein
MLSWVQEAYAPKLKSGFPIIFALFCMLNIGMPSRKDAGVTNYRKKWNLFISNNYVNIPVLNFNHRHQN